MTIRAATLVDIAAIRAVGVAAWYDTYPGMVPDDYIPWAGSDWVIYCDREPFLFKMALISEGTLLNY